MLSGTDRRGEVDDDAFANELLQLKRRGSSVLVVGSVRTELRLATSRRLFGTETEQSRRRIEVTTTGQHHDTASLAHPSNPVTRISYQASARGAAASSSPQDDETPFGPTPGHDSAVEPTSVETLSELGIAIADSVDDHDTDAGGLEPAALRVGIDSLLPLLEEYDKETVFRFVHTLNAYVRFVDGMIHYHLPVERRAHLVSVLAPLFDIVVELREQHGSCQQRWLLNDGTQRSGWLPIDGV